MNNRNKHNENRIYVNLEEGVIRDEKYIQSGLQQSAASDSMSSLGFLSLEKYKLLKELWEKKCSKRENKEILDLND